MNPLYPRFGLRQNRSTPTFLALRTNHFAELPLQVPDRRRLLMKKAPVAFQANRRFFFELNDFSSRFALPDSGSYAPLSRPAESVDRHRLKNSQPRVTPFFPCLSQPPGRHPIALK